MDDPGGLHGWHAGHEPGLSAADSGDDRLAGAGRRGRFWALALGSIAFAIAIDHVTVVQVALVAFVEGSLFVLFDLGERAALVHLVPVEQLPAALAQNQAKTEGADLAGQPLGGLPQPRGVPVS